MVRRASSCLPIAEHGLIGDLHSVALVGTDGTIDWYCCPRFDSPSVLASILDARRGGCYRLAPADRGWTSKQLYFPDTNVLITRFLTPDGVGEVEDFMPVAQSIDGEHRQRLVRRVVAVRGQVRFELECSPRFDYARAEHTVERHEHGVFFRSAGCALALETETPLRAGDGAAQASFSLSQGESATFVLEHLVGGYEPHGHSAAQTRELAEATVAYWRRWLSQSRYTGRWREMVHRSALTLKLLTYQPTGAIVAAATTSLPEQLGGERNWDYRHTWIRDGAFSLYALLRLGFGEEAAAFMGWLTERFRDCRVGESGPRQIMYGIDGRAELPEEQLTHLEGYRGSAPVRIGNGAAKQLQLDIYGELIDSVYLFNKYGTPIYHDAWLDLSRIVEWLSEHWDQPDEGIWEIRGEALLLAIAAGVLFGVSDVAIKYLTHAHGPVVGLLSPWTLTALISFVVSFYASARSLQIGLAIEVIAITSVAANLSAIVGGVLVFGEPIASGAVGIIDRLLAFGLVIAGAALVPAPLRATSDDPAQQTVTS